MSNTASTTRISIGSRRAWRRSACGGSRSSTAKSAWSAFCRWATWRGEVISARSLQTPSLAFPLREARIARLLTASVILAVLAGCSTVSVEQEAEQAKTSWQGATYDEMVMRWGPPNRSATLTDGRQTHTWTSQEGPIRAGGPSVGVGVFGGGGGASRMRGRGGRARSARAGGGWAAAFLAGGGGGGWGGGWGSPPGPRSPRRSASAPSRSRKAGSSTRTGPATRAIAAISSAAEPRSFVTDFTATQPRPCPNPH